MTNKNGPIQLRMVPGQAYVANFLVTFKEYPPRMKPGSFTIDKVMEKLQESGGSK